MLNMQPSSVEDWIKLAEIQQSLCDQLRDQPDMASAVWAQAGFAIECILKAAIHSKERFNTWPKDRKDLHTHDLEKLGSILGMVIDARDPVAPAWAVAVQWRRGHMYNPAKFPPKILKDLLDAVFSEKGVVVWIRQNYLHHY